MPDVSPYVGVALAVLAILSLAVQGLVKALDILGRRSQAAAPPDAPPGTSGAGADPLGQTGPHPVVTAAPADPMAPLIAYVARQMAAEEADQQPATRRDLADLTATISDEAESTREAVQAVRAELDAHVSDTIVHHARGGNAA
jgi:hypothetical protein